MSRASCEDCILRHILFRNLIKNGVVRVGAFKDKDPDGMSLTETVKEIVTNSELDEYLEVVSSNLDVMLGVAVMDAMELSQVGLVWTRAPHDDHKYGHLHVLGPKQHELTDDIRKECARIATMSQLSRSPQPK